MKKHITAVLLSAGTGKRMGQLTHDRTKSLLEVNSRPLIAYMLDFVRHIGVDEVVVVGGYYFDKLKDTVEKLDSSVRLVENADYEKQNLISLSLALRTIEKGGVLVCNTDYIFSGTTASNVANNIENTSIYCSFDLSGDDDDVMRVEANPKGKLVKMSKRLITFNAIYTGISFFDEMALPHVRDTIEDIFKKYDKKDTTVEYIMRELVTQDRSVQVINVGEADWFEFDTPEDLEKARQSLN